MNEGKALVLGGGGIAGLGWLAGLICGLFEAGVDLRDAGRMIGTSAGSVTAAQLRSAQSINVLYARQSDPALIADEPPPSMEVLVALMAAYPALMAMTDQCERMAAMGKLALNANSVAPEARRAMIERRLPEHGWPEAPLSVIAIDIAAGTLVSFEATSDVNFIDAIGASCAVPGVWPVVTIGGRTFTDGGFYSADNAHLAQGAERVLIVSPLGGVAPYPPGYQLADQVTALEQSGSKVLAICPDDDARAAMGTNPLDPAVRIPSATAGRAQGRVIAAQVAQFWN